MPDGSSPVSDASSPVPDASEDAGPDAGSAGARIDTDYGEGGTAVVQALTWAMDIHANSDGTLLLVGYREDRPAVCRVTASGALDDAWGNGGCVLLGTEAGGRADEVAPVGDDYVISVDRPGPSDGVVLWRLQRDGSIDTSIGDGGQIALGPSTHEGIGSGACAGVTPGGDHLVVGAVGRGVGAFRLSSAGEVLQFHRVPSVITSLLGSGVTDTGDLIAVGIGTRSMSSPKWRPVAVRFTADLEQAIDLVPLWPDESYAASALGSGASTVLVTTSVLVRARADGTADPGFSPPTCQGCVFLDLAPAGDDRILVHGMDSSDGTQLHILRADGTPDETAAPGGLIRLPDEASSAYPVEGGTLASSNGRVFVLRQRPDVGQQRVTSILLD